ncbi:MAG: tripartite tricarboxylate transporter substrate binding protein [Deltaproteobacteria bacterium]|nr:tripartite tricarboxylate transporter substrate binding protein [Deltaproteobacteria bacterium]
MQVSKKTILLLLISIMAIGCGDDKINDFTLIVPWSAGGGTDATARALAPLLAKELGVEITVVNRTGEGGVTGHQAMLDGDPKSTLGICTGELATYHWLGQSNITYADFTLIGLYNTAAAAITVSATSSWLVLQDLLDDIDSNPSGTYSMSGASVGSPQSLAVASLFKTKGIDPLKIKMETSSGAADALNLLKNGTIDMMPNSLPEVKADLDAGNVRSLVVLAPERIDNESFADVPTALEAVGEDIVGGTYRTLCGPAGMSESTVNKVTAAFVKVYNSTEFENFMVSNNNVMTFATGSACKDWLAAADIQAGQSIEDLGLAP